MGSINGVDFLVFRFCQTPPAVCPLAFLAAVATLTFELGGTVLVSLLLWPLPPTLIELAVFRCVAGTSAHEASLSLAFANGTAVHRCRTCTAGFRLHSSAILVEDAATLKKL